MDEGDQAAPSPPENQSQVSSSVIFESDSSDVKTTDSIVEEQNLLGEDVCTSTTFEHTSENVEDLAQDLENLLSETQDSFTNSRSTNEIKDEDLGFVANETFSKLDVNASIKEARNTSDEVTVLPESETVDNIIKTELNLVETSAQLDISEVDTSVILESGSEPTENQQGINPQIDDDEPVEETNSVLAEPLTIEVGDPPGKEVLIPGPVEEYKAKISEPETKAPLRMTITKHKTNDAHSILKICSPQEHNEFKEQPTQFKVEEANIMRICTRSEGDDSQQSPKLIIRAIKSPNPEVLSVSEQNVPKLIIKPIPSGSNTNKHTLKLDQKSEMLSPLKIIIKPPNRTEEFQIARSSPTYHSPKITIKPIIKPDEPEEPKFVVKQDDDFQMARSSPYHSPKITIKPIVKPEEHEESKIVKQEDDFQVTRSSPSYHSPKITIKPIVKPEEPEESKIIVKEDDFQMTRSSPTYHSPKITIKPIVKPEEPEESKFNIKQEELIINDDMESVDAMELVDFEEQIKQERIVLKIQKNSFEPVKEEIDRSGKLGKIKLKLSKEGGHPHIVQEKMSFKRFLNEDEERQRRFKSAAPDLHVSLIQPDYEVKEDFPEEKEDHKMVIDDSQDVILIEDNQDPLSEIPVFEISRNNAVVAAPVEVIPPVVPAPVVPVVTAPRKRGRPRKVPLEVREEFKDLPKEEVQVVEESNRPKRSCRGTSVKATLGIKPRKPRAAPRARGNKRAPSSRSTTSRYTRKQDKLKQIFMKDSFDMKETDLRGTDKEFALEEETRMSADSNSRGQTPAKQVSNSTHDLIDESQSSVQSSTTTESEKKVKRGSRLEVHQEPEGAILAADQLAEYYWNGGGPYMLQEQVAQFLGIKSFKRKYPGIQRRPVDMQERDFIRESGLVSESMCDMGLTSVNSADILDIMYTDFQHKYEEYCKHQRDRQAKDVTNKQRALSLAASQEKNKLDITEQAVQSASSWNATFNKSRREHRKAAMDLQTFTVHFPKGKMKQVNKPQIGNYPLALVPGQYTDYFKGFSVHELSNLPLNTLGSKINIPDVDDSQSDGSASDSESSSSDSDSSYSGSSGAEDCKMCSSESSLKKNCL